MKSSANFDKIRQKLKLRDVPIEIQETKAHLAQETRRENGTYIISTNPEWRNDVATTCHSLVRIYLAEKYNSDVFVMSRCQNKDISKEEYNSIALATATLGWYVDEVAAEKFPGIVREEIRQTVDLIEFAASNISEKFQTLHTCITSAICAAQSKRLGLAFEKKIGNLMGELYIPFQGFYENLKDLFLGTPRLPEERSKALIHVSSLALSTSRILRLPYEVHLDPTGELWVGERVKVK